MIFINLTVVTWLPIPLPDNPVLLYFSTCLRFLNTKALFDSDLCSFYPLSCKTNTLDTDDHGCLLLGDQHPVSGGTTSKIVSSARRTSLPFTKRATTQETAAYNPTVGILQNVKSPEYSINEPQVDKIAIFPLAPYEQDIFFTPMQRKTSSNCSSVSDRSITKDKCTVQTCKSGSDYIRWQGIQLNMLENISDGSSSSDQNATAGASSQTTSSNTRRCRFDPSSYRQRADALEGLLEFSARLLQEGRYDELNVLLKPFGPGKVSPRETAIWIAKSLKENRDKTKTADVNVYREIPPVGLL